MNLDFSRTYNFSVHLHRENHEPLQLEALSVEPPSPQVPSLVLEMLTVLLSLSLHKWEEGNLGTTEEITMYIGEYEIFHICKGGIHISIVTWCFLNAICIWFSGIVSYYSDFIEALYENLGGNASVTGKNSARFCFFLYSFSTLGMLLFTLASVFQ